MSAKTGEKKSTRAGSLGLDGMGIPYQQIDNTMGDDEGGDNMLVLL